MKSNYKIIESPNYSFYKGIVRINDGKLLYGWSKNSLDDVLKELQGLEEEIKNYRKLIGLEKED